jgi:hypothetical protein
MKIIQSLSALIAVLFLTCCDESDPGVSYFEVAVEDDYIAANGDMWVFIHDSNGAVLDAKPLSNGKVRRFSAQSPASKITVTIASTTTHSGHGSQFINLKSYLAVNTPARWTLKRNQQSVVNCGDNKGTVTITINDPAVGGVYESCLSNPGSFNWPDNNISTSTSLVFRPMDVKKLCDDYFLYVMGKDQQPRYKLLDDIAPGTYDFTLNDFSAFDHTIDVSFPKPTFSNLTVKALEASQSVYDPATFINYASKGVFQTDLHTVKAGYLNKYSRYVTDVDIFYIDSHRYQYKEAPGRPASIDLPFNFTPAVTDKSLINYQYTTNQEVAFRESLFVYFSMVQSEYSIEWSVFADGDNSFKHPAAVPESFLKKYPGFYYEKTTHNFSRFYTQYKSLNELVAELYQDAILPEAFKYVSKSVYH